MLSKKELKDLTNTELIEQIETESVKSTWNIKNARTWDKARERYYSEAIKRMKVVWGK
jgi:hypothetical protein